VDAALSLGGAILVGETNEASLALSGIVQPLGLLALELVIDEAHAAVSGNLNTTIAVLASVSLRVSTVAVRCVWRVLTARERMHAQQTSMHVTCWFARDFTSK
jgi:hypothetical protein